MLKTKTLQKVTVSQLLGLITAYALEDSNCDFNISNKKIAEILIGLNSSHKEKFGCRLWDYQHYDETDEADILTRTRKEIEGTIAKDGHIKEYADFENGDQSDFVHFKISDLL